MRIVTLVLFGWDFFKYYFFLIKICLVPESDTKAIFNFFSVGIDFKTSQSDVHRYQILTSKVSPTLKGLKQVLGYYRLCIFIYDHNQVCFSFYGVWALDDVRLSVVRF